MQEDFAELGCLPPTHEPRATAYIPQMLSLIEKLEEDDDVVNVFHNMKEEEEAE